MKLAAFWLFCTLSALCGFLFAAWLGKNRMAEMEWYISELLNDEFNAIEDWVNGDSDE